jgi:aspartate racemase
MTKIVGILGGMGPMSTVDLMRMITEMTPVEQERDHLRLLVDSRPQIPDRPAALLGTGPSPVPMLQESARLLEKWGAELLAIPCNTAHGFLTEVQDVLSIEVLDMIGLVGKELGQAFPTGTPVGLLATTAAGRSRVFHDRLPDYRLLIPSDGLQEELVTEAILQVKLGEDLPGARGKLWKAVDSLIAPRPAAVIAGCTEVELALSGSREEPYPVLRPMALLAEEIVRRAWREEPAREGPSRPPRGRTHGAEPSGTARADA